MQRRKPGLDKLTLLLLAMTASSGLAAILSDAGEYRLLAVMSILLATLLLFYRVWTLDGAPDDRAGAR